MVWPVSGDRERNDDGGEKDEKEFAGDAHALFLKAGFAAGPGAPRRSQTLDNWRGEGELSVHATSIRAANKV